MPRSQKPAKDDQCHAAGGAVVWRGGPELSLISLLSSADCSTCPPLDRQEGIPRCWTSSVTSWPCPWIAGTHWTAILASRLTRWRPWRRSPANCPRCPSGPAMGPMPLSTPRSGARLIRRAGVCTARPWGSEGVVAPGGLMTCCHVASLVMDLCVDGSSAARGGGGGGVLALKWPGGGLKTHAHAHTHTHTQPCSSRCLRCSYRIAPAWWRCLCILLLTYGSGLGRCCVDTSHVFVHHHPLPPFLVSMGQQPHRRRADDQRQGTMKESRGHTNRLSLPHSEDDAPAVGPRYTSPGLRGVRVRSWSCSGQRPGGPRLSACAI